MPRGGSTVVFGKITVSSDVDGLDKVLNALDVILANYNYPEAVKKDGSVDGSDAPYFGEKANVPKKVADVQEMVLKAKPAEDSIESDWGVGGELDEGDDAELEEKYDDAA